MSYTMTDNFLEFEGGSDLIDLDKKHIEEALELSTQGETTDRRWNLYLQALTRLGFEEWLRKRSPSLKPLEVSRSGMQEHQISVVQVGHFKVGLIAVVGLSDPDVLIPSVIRETQHNRAHFYGVISVSEEEEIAAMQGFLRQDELMGILSELTPDQEGDYAVAIAAFNPDMNELLLNLHCLNLEAIPLATRSVEQTKTQPLVNVGRWVQRQLDEVRDELGWLLMPTPALLRKGAIPMSPLEDTLIEIKRQTGMHIPVTAVRGYQDFPQPLPPLTRNGGSSRVRLSVVSWPLPEVENEWSLLLVLGAMPDVSPPYGTSLEVWDETQVLVKEELREENHSAYLYAHVEGIVGERFEARIILPGETEPFLFPFTYRPEELGA